jgi:hypothetical protein
LPPLSFERAYWRAFNLVFGEQEGRVLRAVLLAKAEARGRRAATAWETVHGELEEILADQARAILALAERIRGEGEEGQEGGAGDEDPPGSASRSWR